MSTVCKILVGSIDADQIEYLIQSHMADALECEIEKSEQEWPAAQDDDVFIGDFSDPTLFCIRAAAQGFTEIHYNSFSPNETLCETLSREMGATVVVNIYQSTAEACYWAYYLDGKALRILETGDGETIRNEGVLLPFEKEPLGHDIGTEDDPFIVFDSDDMEEYNRHVGIDALVYHQLDNGWTVLKRKPAAVSSPPRTTAKGGKKPWWKFW